MITGKNLPLSLLGRIAVIKSILFPKISYVFAPLYPTRSDILSFSQICERYGLPARDFYIKQGTLFPLKSLSAIQDSILLILSLLKTRSYKIKNLYTPLLKPQVQGQWEKSLTSWSQDLSLEITPELLLNHCGSVRRWLPSAAMQETHLKCIQRAYISPSRRRYMVPDETGHCRKCGLSNSSYFHCFWECGKIKNILEQDYSVPQFHILSQTGRSPCTMPPLKLH